MLSLNGLNTIIENVLREARRKWVEAWVEKIKVLKRKFVLTMSIGGNKVKIIIYRDQAKVRVYCRLRGLSISLRKIFLREYEKYLRLKELEKKEELV